MNNQSYHSGITSKRSPVPQIPKRDYLDKPMQEARNISLSKLTNTKDPKITNLEITQETEQPISSFKIRIPET